MRVSKMVWVAVVSLLSLSLNAQILERSIPLSDDDPSSADHPFGITLHPSGTSAFVTLCGDPATSNFAAWNNNDVLQVDLWSGTRLAMGNTGLFPEDCCVVKTAAGTARHIYVADSTSGTVTCLSPALVPVATITLSSCFGGTFFSVFPFGLLASPDGTRVYVTTTGGCDAIDVIDSDPLSPTFNTRISSFTVAGGGGRPTWLSWPLMLVPTTQFDTNFLTSRAGFTVVDVSNPATQSPHLVSSIPLPFQYHFATEVQALSNGRILVTIGGEALPTFYECLPNGTVTRSLPLNTLTGINLHGLAVDPEERLAVVTSISGSDTIWVDLSTFTVVGAYDHGGISKPNDAIFSPDGSRVFVTLQGTTQIDVMSHVPGYNLSCEAPAAVSNGSTLTVNLRHCESGQPYGLWVSTSGGGPINAGAFTVFLTPPLLELASGIGSLTGTATHSFPIPSGPAFVGLSAWFQAVTVDRDLTVRLSNGASTSIF